MRSIALAAAALAIGAACRSTSTPVPDAVTWEELPPPSWRIVARRDGKVLLAANRVIVRGIRRRDDRQRGAGVAQSVQEYPTLIFESGRLLTGPVARAAPIALGDGARDTLRLYSLEFRGQQVLLSQTGEGPALNESPVEPGLYVVEHDDRLWLLANAGATLLTADTVQGIARDTLRSQTGEMGPHLFWATVPSWSPDGSAVTYVTNRKWMLARESSQEVWLAELRPWSERPLLSERGEVFAPQGWLGLELVYTIRRGRISAVDLRTGKSRTVAPGSAVTFSPSGSRLLYMTSVGDSVRGHVLTKEGVVDIPDTPGQRLNYAGTFSPSGGRLALGTSFAADSGITRAIYVFDIGTRRLTPLKQWSFRVETRHPFGLPAWLDESTLLLTQLDRATGLESSTLVRLPRSR